MNKYWMVSLGTPLWAGRGPQQGGHTPCLLIGTERLKEEKFFTSTFWNVSVPTQDNFSTPSFVIQQNESFNITITFKETKVY